MKPTTFRCDGSQVVGRVRVRIFWLEKVRLCKSTNSSGLVVSADGLEPSTHALKGHCSAN
jgi:hypothetical protein